MHLTDYGFSPSLLPENPAGMPARVTSVCRDRFEIVTDSGSGSATLKGSVYYAGGAPFPTVGDYVLVAWQPAGDSRILETLPRTSFFSRRDPTKGQNEQAIAANFDYVFILQSLNGNFNPRRLERYLTTAWQSGATPVVLLTKADACPDPAPYLAAAALAAPGAQVLCVSAVTGQGLDDLAPCLRPGKTIVFLGSSGVGKSTLVNALAGESLMAAGEIRENDSKGRHTTTHRQLLLLKNGVIVIDTPGMREFGLYDAEDGLEQSFADVEQYLGHCRFASCRHQAEPGCAILAAIESGELSADRWQSYQRLKREAHRDESLAAMKARKKAWSKSVALYNRKNKKGWEE